MPSALREWPAGAILNGPIRLENAFTPFDQGIRREREFFAIRKVTRQGMFFADGASRREYETGREQGGNDIRRESGPHFAQLRKRFSAGLFLA
jgi:hypothetical protein